MDSLRLPLAKFSRAVDATPDVQQFNWRHVTQDLVLASDTFRGPGGHVGSPTRLLKVLQGTEVLELLPLEDLLDQAREVIVTMRNLGVEIKNEQLPISALFKSPLLAIRYNLPDRKLRRIQLKFTCSQDFDLVYQHLDRLGLRMSQIEAKQGQSTSSPAAPVRGIPGPSCPPSKISELSNRPYSAVPAPYPQTKASSTPRVSSPLAHQSFTSSSDVPQQDANFQRPASAYSGLVNRERNPLASLTASIPNLPDSLVPPEYFPRPDSAVSAASTGRLSTAMERSAHSDLPTIEEATSPSAFRPSSAQFFAPPRINDTALPPRRELPFARSTPPQSAGSDNARPFSRASSSSIAPLSGNRASRTPSRGLSSQAFDPPPLPRPTFLEEIGTLERPVSRRRSDIYSLPAGADDELRNKLSRAAPYSAGHDAAQSGGQKEIRPLSALSTSSLNMRPQSSSPFASPHKDRLPTPTTSEVSYQGHQDRVISEMLNQSRNNGAENLAAYAAHNNEDRMMILNDFMMSQLDDNNFCTLVEDVSVCWARVGLGLD